MTPGELRSIRPSEIPTDGCVRILGLDPGLASTGWGVLDVYRGRIEYVAHGCVSTAPSDPLEQRLLAIHRKLQDILELYKPAEGAMESLYFAKNVTSALSVSEAKGVLRLTCVLAGLALTEYGPGAIKQAIVGRGRADKAQVQEFVRIVLGLPDLPRPDHAADALAAAICHAHSRWLGKIRQG